MKRSLLMGLLAVGMSAHGQNAANSLVMSWTEGSDDAVRNTTFVLGEIKNLTFNSEDGTLMLETISGESTSFSDEQAWSATFAYVEPEEDAIVAVEADGVVELWSLSGTLLRSAANGEALPLGDLPKGVYVIRQGGKARKITI